MIMEEPKSAGHVAFLESRQRRVDALKARLLDIYPDPVGLTVEIGCGHGHYLTALAQAHPDDMCLGIDLVTKRIEKACQKRDKRQLHNLQFLKAEVREFMMAWPEHLWLERVFILFPDPWPKKRHAKNRIIQQQLLHDLATRGREGSTLHFRTDDEDNFSWGLEMVASCPGWIIDDHADWPFENPSFFQDLFSRHYSLTARLAGSAGD